MRCKRLDDLLPAYMDGDLPGRLNQHVSDHLDRCERCRQELTAQQRALRSLTAGRRPVSIDLWADFSRRLQAQAPPRPSPWRLLWQPGLATALAAVAVALIAGTAPKTRPAPAGTRLRVSGRPRLVQVAERPELEVVPPPSLPRSGPAGMPLPSDPGSRQAAAFWMQAPVKHRSAASHPARRSS